jgi:hypothetical protein
MSPDAKNHNQTVHIMKDSEGISMYLMFCHSGQQIVILSITTVTTQKLIQID